MRCLVAGYWALSGAPLQNVAVAWRLHLPADGLQGGLDPFAGAVDPDARSNDDAESNAAGAFVGVITSECRDRPCIVEGRRLSEAPMGTRPWTWDDSRGWGPVAPPLVLLAELVARHILCQQRLEFRRGHRHREVVPLARSDLEIPKLPKL